MITLASMGNGNNQAEWFLPNVGSKALFSSAKKALIQKGLGDSNIYLPIRVMLKSETLNTYPKNDRLFLFRCTQCQFLIVSNSEVPKTEHSCMVDQRRVKSFGVPKLIESGPADTILNLAITMNQEGPNQQRKGI